LATELWTEKWRPKTLSEYVFRDEQQKRQLHAWVADGVLPTLLFTGGPGTGKTSISRVLINELKVHPLDFKYINASNNNGIDEMRTTITNFASMMPVGDMRYVLLDEFDFVTPNAQAAFRGIIENFQSTCRFIMTANYPHKISPAIHSRAQGFHIESLDINEFTSRIAEICIAEGVEIDLDTVDSYVQATYPDLRKCINMVQQNVLDGVLAKPTAGDNQSTTDWMVNAVELFKVKKYYEARQLICSKARPEEYDDIYKFLYRNLHFWGEERVKQDQAVVTIRDGLVKQVSCADVELNLAATLIELAAIAES